MPTTIIRHEAALAPRGLFEIPDASGLRLACTKGSLWITLDNDTRDIVLEAGESFFTTEHRRALVYAFGPSVLEIREPGRESARQPERTRSMPAFGVAGLRHVG